MTLFFISILNLFTRVNTHIALRKKTSSTFAPVTVATITENRSPNIETTIAIIGLLIGTKKRRQMGIKRRIAVKDTSRILARIVSLLVE